MRYFHPTIERHMRGMAGRWKMLRFLQHSGTLGAIACVAATLLGIAMWRCWLENPYMALSLLWILGAFAIMAWLILMITFATQARPRSWLAEYLEKGHGPLLDRVNTLVFLGGKKRSAGTQSYIRRIEAQASKVLETARPRNPFPVLRPLVHLWMFAALLFGTLWFYGHFQPVARLMVAWNARQSQRPEKADAPAFKLPDTDATEEKKPWSEVRITDPAGDIKATKVDVVPLEIEAASNQSLNNVSWALSVDGGTEQPQPLNPPAEPHYAVYQPVIPLDELHLSDWDVVSYYAKASVESGDSSSSNLYFIDIRPFREDVMKMPGGEGGKAARTLGEMTSLIERQRLILRETHRYNQQPSTDAKVREGDRKKLEDAESELGDSVTQYYAKMAADFENQPIADTLDHLAMSGTYIDRATTALKNDFAAQALPNEQASLTELGATRKDFQKFINEHPDAFKDDQDDQDSTPFASTNKLDKIAEYRDAEKAAQDFLQKTEDKQKQLADKTKDAASGDTGNSGGYSGMDKEQEDLAKSLSDFESQNPDLFHDLDKESAATQEAMKAAASTLKTADARSKLINSLNNLTGQPASMTGKASAAARVATTQENAVNSIDELKNAFANKDTTRQIQHAHELKNMLERQAQDLDKAGANPGAQKPGQTAQTAKNAGQTVEQLKDIVDHTKAGDSFGQQLHDALSDDQQGKVSGQLARLAQAQDAASQAAAAQDAANSLHDITKAFDASMPATMRQAQQGNPLSPNAEEAMNQAMQELDSLQAAKQGGAPMSPAAEAKQREDARLNLTKSIPQLYGSNDSTAALIDEVNKELKGNGKPVDVDALKKLIDQIQNLRIEMDDKKMEKPDKEELSHIDPSKLPAEYRERVERYFQKLSEQ